MRAPHAHESIVLGPKRPNAGGAGVVSVARCPRIRVLCLCASCVPPATRRGGSTRPWWLARMVEGSPDGGRTAPRRAMTKDGADARRLSVASTPQAQARSAQARVEVQARVGAREGPFGRGAGRWPAVPRRGRAGALAAAAPSASGRAREATGETDDQES